MRRRLLVLFLVVALTLLLAACGGGKEEVVLPEVTETAINQTVDMLMQEELVEDAHIEVKDDKIIIAIIANPAISEEYAKEVGENGARFLATMAITVNKELEGPTKDHLGDLYDFYDLQIGVGTSPKDFIVQGAKAKSASKIRW